MAQNTAPLIAKSKAPRDTSKGKSRPLPIDCVGCWGPKEKRKYLFCRKCRLNYLAARKRERELDELLDWAIEFSP